MVNLPPTSPFQAYGNLPSTALATAACVLHAVCDFVKYINGNLLDYDEILSKLPDYY